MKVTVAAIQMDSIVLDKKRNLEKSTKLIKQAVEKKSQLIVLPELFSTGYRTEDEDYELSESISGPTAEWLMYKARKYNVYITGTILERDQIKGVVYNTAILVGPEGYIGKYRKTHLWQQEKIRFAAGTEIPVFHTDIGAIGLQVCYEIGYPEISRLLALRGAEIIACPSAFGKPRLYVWQLATRSRAIENGLFLVASNRCGIDKDSEFAGNSRIVSPRGNILKESFVQEEVVISTIDLSDVAKQRASVPYLQDFNKDLYVKNL